MELFPTTIAVGKAFCNRVQERKQLKHYAEHGRHAVLIAPRRYGKTSLINQTLLELKLPYCIMELTLATSAKDVEHIVVKHVGDLLYKLLPKTIKAQQKILKLFKWLNPELILTVGGQKLILHPTHSHLDAVDNLTELLKKLDQAAAVAKKRVVVVMDEFQQLNDIQNHSIEAAIRHAMQYSKHVSYIFSGSNRQMLLSMFHNKNKPFYNSCETIKLERISKEDYRHFIQHAAQQQWKKHLPEDVLTEIFTLSALHPGYINRICGYFWLLDEFPVINQVRKYWQRLVESKRAEFAEDILRLSRNQKKLLSYLAGNPSANLSSHEVCSAIGLSDASVRQAAKKLLQSDYIYKDQNGITHVLDPAFKDFIKNLLS